MIISSSNNDTNPNCNNNTDLVISKPVSGREPPPIYDLVGVSNHHGTLNGGHYVAHVDTEFGQSKGQSPRWICFNDARVSLANAANIAGPTAYVLFYKLREDTLE
jgi:ubiquitin C-terminal hydrolase